MQAGIVSYPEMLRVVVESRANGETPRDILDNLTGWGKELRLGRDHDPILRYYNAHNIFFRVNYYQTAGFKTINRVVSD